MKRVFTSSSLSFHSTAVARATELMVVTEKGSPEGYIKDGLPPYDG